MEIIEKPIDEIKPDPNQPRTIFRQDDITALAASLEYDYKTGNAHKMINPIEIDKDGVIITGEQRWKAAKLANWKTVPVKIVDPGEAAERFLRQVKENVNRGTMTPMDTAKALGKVRDNLTNAGQHQPKSPVSKEEYIRATARVVGASNTFVQDMLSLLEETEPIQKAIENNDIKYSSVVEIVRAPEEFRNKLKEKVLKEGWSNREGIRSISRALHRNPEKADELLKIKMKGASSETIITSVNDISPSPIMQISTATDKANRIIRLIRNLTEMLNSTQITAIPPLQRGSFSLGIENLQKALEKFLTQQRSLN